jgi:hypothetical protein
MEREEGQENRVNLSGELSGRRYDDCADMVALGGLLEAQKSLDKRNEEGESFSAASDGLEELN